MRPFRIAIALSLWIMVVVVFAWSRHPSMNWAKWSQAAMWWQGISRASVDLNWDSAPGFGIPYWMLVVVTLIVPVLGIRRRVMSSLRKASSHCPRCGYDLRASTGRCPECGSEFFPATSVPEPRVQPPPLEPLPKPRQPWQKDRAATLWRVRHRNSPDPASGGEA
jgi:hypothetical protein